MRNTGTPPSRAGLWNWAKQQYTGTRNELLLHFPAEIQGQAGRPRGKRVAGIDGGDY